MERNNDETVADGNKWNIAKEKKLPIVKLTRALTDQKPGKEEFIDTEQAKIERRRNRIKAAMLIASSSQWFEAEAQTRDMECPDDIDPKEWAITWAHLAELKNLDFGSLYRGLTNGMPNVKVVQVTPSVTTVSHHGGARYYPLDVTRRIGHKPASETYTALGSNPVEKMVTQMGVVSDTGIGRLTRLENNREKNHTASMNVGHAKSPPMSDDKLAAMKNKQSALISKNEDEDDFSEEDEAIFRNLRVAVSDNSSEWENLIPEPANIGEVNDIFPARQGSSANVLSLAYPLNEDVVIPKQAPRRFNNKVAPLLAPVCDQSRRFTKSGYIAPDYSIFTASGLIGVKNTSRGKESLPPRYIGKSVSPQARKGKLVRKGRGSESTREMHTVQVSKGGSFSRLLRRIRSFSCFGRNSVVAPM